MSALPGLERDISGDRERAESFGAAARLYDETRPSYPDALIAWLGEGGVGTAVDVGCGTGQVARLLCDAGWNVLGVEVDERMAAVAEEHGIDVVVSPFEDWVPDRVYDLVCSGQAWHWIDPSVGYERAAGALRSGGRLAVFWNAYHYDTLLRSVIDVVFARHAPDLLVESVALGTANTDFGALDLDAARRSGPWFEPVVVREFEHRRRQTVDAWIAEMHTHSPVAVLAADTRAALFADLRASMAERDRDEIEVRHVTRVTTARKR